MTLIHEYSKLGEMVAKDHIKKFLKDVKRWSPEGIDYIRHKESITMFNKRFVKNRDLYMKEIIQGENEINLAVNLHNIMHSEYGWN
jgi:hypothetical protein